MENYRFNDQLFRLKSKISLLDINKKLGLNNKRSKEDNCVQIVKELIEKYHYVWAHNSYYILVHLLKYTEMLTLVKTNLSN